MFDVNLRAPYFSAETVRQSLELANVLKLNEEELPRLTEWFGSDGDNDTDQIGALAEQFDLKMVALTRGGEGSVLWTADEISERPTPAVNVVDTVGAGDSFTAALVTGMLRGDSLPSIHQYASEVAAFVCSQSGATPDLKNMA